MVARALLAVWGMSCPDCAMQVRNSLVELAGVVNAYVDYIHGMARDIQSGMVTVPAMIGAVAGRNDGQHEYPAMPSVGTR
jgi:copper chaperone CopZ